MSANKTLSLRRREKDIFKLRSANYEVVEAEQPSTYQVTFKGTTFSTQDQSTRLTKRANGASISTCPTNTLTRVPRLVFSIKSTTPISTMGKLAMIQFGNCLPRRYQPDLDADVRIGQHF